MDYAHQKGLQFGTDITFSYGPLGFLITPYFCPSSPWLRVATDGGLTCAILLGFSLLAWRMSVLWRCIAIGMFVFLAANADPRNELLISVGLLCWSLMSLVETGTRLLVSIIAFAGLAVFSVLAKVTLLFAAMLSLGALAACFSLERKPSLALGLIIGSGALLLLAWTILGQDPLNLGPFLANAVRISAGYDQAMWADPFPVLKWPGLLMVILAWSVSFLCLMPATERKNSKWYGGVMLIWLTSFLFIVWKHGFVRAGRDHLEVFFGVVPAMALVMGAWPCACRARRLWARSLALTCCVVSVVAVQWLFAGNLKSCLARPFRLAALHATNLMKPIQYQRQLRELQQAEGEANQLPRLRSKIGSASVDVFGCNQAYAIFNHLNFRPRPVFQSYAAYSAPLMSLNEQFYFSKRAPDYVLFALNPIDERFPPLEDARLFRDLLINYQPLDAEGPFLLLKARQCVTPSLSLLREGTIGAGDVIGLKGYGNADLWLEIGVEPDMAGRFGRFLYRPSEITLAVWCETPTRRVARFRAPAPMLAAGFLASPLPLDNRDVLDLYIGKPITRPSAYSIELSQGAQHLWEDAIRFRLFKIENQMGNCASPELSRLLEYPGFEVAPEEVVSARHAMITVAGKPALFLPPGGYMRFAAPRGARLIEGSYGFAPAAYLLGGKAQGAEFRIEAEQFDGNLRLLLAQTLRPRSNPDDRGMKPFSVACSAAGTRRLILRVLPLGTGDPMWDLTCWADIRFR